MKNFFSFSAVGVLAVATPLFADAAPPVPSGDISYTSVTGATDYTPEEMQPVYSTAVQTPETYANTSRFTLKVNAYSTNYQVRGMGVTNQYSAYGWSSADLTWRPGSNNLFGRGIGQEVNLGYGIIYGANDLLGDTGVWNLGYGLTKELFPNLHFRAGLGIHYGGLEGYLAKTRDKAPHRIASDLNFSLTYNDNQKGFFGGATFGVGFQGLTGFYGDVYVGYRLQDVFATERFCLDTEISVGQSYSLGYWTGGAEGFDATRLRVDFKPYTTNGSLGRDAKIQFVPYVQTSWTGNNAKKIERSLSSDVADHFQFTIGVDLIFNF